MPPEISPTTSACATRLLRSEAAVVGLQRRVPVQAVGDEPVGVEATMVTVGREVQRTRGADARLVPADQHSGEEITRARRAAGIEHTDEHTLPDPALPRDVAGNTAEIGVRRVLRV